MTGLDTNATKIKLINLFVCLLSLYFTEAGNLGMESLRKKQIEDTLEEPSIVKEAHDKLINSADFNVQYFLSKSLPSLSLETIKTGRDRHLRVFTKYATEVNKEIFQHRDSILHNLSLFFRYKDMLDGVTPHIDPFLRPIFLFKRSKGKNRRQQHLLTELKKFNEDLKDLAADSRYLLKKEKVLLTIDKSDKEGVVLITNDMVIIGVYADALSFYNALHIRELEIIQQPSAITLRVRPVTVTIKPTKDTKDFKGIAPLLLPPKKPAPPRPAATEGERESGDYIDFLIRTHQTSSLARNSSAETSKASLLSIKNVILREYKVNGRITPEVKSNLGILRRASSRELVEAFFSIKEQELSTLITASLTSDLYKLIDQVSLFISKTISEMAKWEITDPHALSLASLHLEHLHTHSISLLSIPIYNTYAADSKIDIGYIEGKFKYKGYSYGYTAQKVNAITKKIVKKKYLKKKEIIGVLFKE